MKKLSKDWEFHIDNRFAAKFLKLLPDRSHLMQGEVPAPILCDRCTKQDFYEVGLEMIFQSPEPWMSFPKCHLCKLFLGICDSHGVEPGMSVAFVRNGSTLAMSDKGRKLPVLSLLSWPTVRSDDIMQLGMPPDRKLMDSHLETLLNVWLEDCDKNHTKCQTEEARKLKLPTRLIEVTPDSLRLVRSARESLTSATEYLALSHPWGVTADFRPFCTYLTNSQQDGHSEACFLEGIEYDQLPTTFQHAVNVTRHLGISYLWIDSICILQGDDGDFKKEVSRMEDVFSGAYCVIAANAADNQHSGFLNKRVTCNFVKIAPKQIDQASLYICQGVDNFKADVLDSYLNSRGWVLQERALARRTIYFTEGQIYFECGDGIRCETLSKMSNSIVGLLGDPHFPSKVVKTNSKGQKIIYFQELFKEYSKLNFSNESDRPIAINGLESRLHRAYQSIGQFGVFSDGINERFFHRSMLWKITGDKRYLDPIDFDLSRSRPVPTWSWMAYRGPIDYLNPPFGEMDWSQDIIPPWQKQNGVGNEDVGVERTTDIGIIATTWSYDVSGGGPASHKIYLDLDPVRDSVPRDYRCVIVGMRKSSGPDEDKQHCVLIVAVKKSSGGKMFERAGVAFMLGSQIKRCKGSIRGEIV